jgi:hypothetical protein
MMEVRGWLVIVEEALSGVGSGCTVPLKLASRLAIANGVMEQMGAYRPLALPDRPAMVPDDNNEVFATLERGRRARAETDDRKTARRFVQWREEVAKLESLGLGNLLILLEAMDTYRLIAEAGGEDDDIARKRDMLLEHVTRWWGELDAGMTSGDRLERQASAARRCRRVDVMPNWLFNGEPPPHRFVPSAYRDEPRAEAEEDEDDADL